MAKLQDNRSLGRPLLFSKQRVVRHHQVDPRRFHVAQGAHRVLQFALQRTLIIDLLIELRTDPVGLVEDFKTQPPALDSSLGGRGQPRLVQLRCRNANAGSISRHVE